MVRLWWIFLMALALRWLAALFVAEIQYEDVIYFDFQCAARFADGDFAGGYMHWVPPLYPFLLGLAYKLTNDMEAAGKAVGVLCGALAVFPAAAIARRLGGARAAQLAALLLAVLPFHVAYSARISSHAPYSLCFALALAAGLRLVRSGRIRDGAAFGVSAGVAYWIRQEATALVLVTCTGLLALAVVPAWRSRLARGAASTIAAAGGAAALFALAILPVVLWTHEATGRWVLSSKGGASVFGAGRALNELAGDGVHVLWETRITSMSDYQEVSPIAHLREHPGSTLATWAAQFLKNSSHSPRVFWYVAFPFALLALIRRRSPERWALGDLYAGGFVLFNVAALSFFYESARLLLSMSALFSAWSAIGAIECGDWLAARAPGLCAPRSWLEPPRAAIALLLLALPFHIHGASKWGFRIGPSPDEIAGEWLRERFSNGRTIMDPDGNIAFHAGGVPVVLPVAGAREMLHYARHRTPAVEFLAYRGSKMEKGWAAARSEIESGAVGGFELIHEEPGPDPVRIYRVVPP